MAIEREDRINSVADAECPQILASNVLRPERDQLVDLLVVALGSALTCEVRRKRFILVGDTIEDNAWIYQQPQPLVRQFESQRCTFAPADLGMIADSALDQTSDLGEFMPRGIYRSSEEHTPDIQSPILKQYVIF